MNDSLRVIQFFLSPTSTPAIFEVSTDSSDNLFCNCPGYAGRHTCKHTVFVKARIDNNNGVYPMEISTKATKEDAEKAKKSNKDFREFVLKFGKIEVC